MYGKGRIKDTCIGFLYALEKVCWSLLGVADRNFSACEQEKEHETKTVRYGIFFCSELLALL